MQLRSTLNRAPVASFIDAAERNHCPGGMVDENFVIDLMRGYPNLPRKLIHHYARLYGTRARELLGADRISTDLGRHFGGDLYEREAAYLRENEWATRAADFLEQRTKHGLHLTREQRED
jgi:glycerol-3-phosphate dehydrogenase